MKIKHYQGYGYVNAYKIHCDRHGLTVKVVGNHEWGLDRSDFIDDVFNWLVKRFDKKYCTDWNQISSVSFEYADDEIVDGVATEVGIYTISYRNSSF